MLERLSQAFKIDGTSDEAGASVDPDKQARGALIQEMRALPEQDELAGAAKGAIIIQLTCIADFERDALDQISRRRLFQRRKAKASLRAAESALDLIKGVTNDDIYKFLTYGIGLDAVRIGGLTPYQYGQKLGAILLNQQLENSSGDGMDLLAGPAQLPPEPQPTEQLPSSP